MIKFDDAFIADFTPFVVPALTEYPACFRPTEKACIRSRFKATRALNYWETLDENDC